MDRYLRETPILDYGSAPIQAPIHERGWSELPEFERARAIYYFVRDEILFGYNADDGIPASRVLADGFGQCNTKGTLFMALLRSCGIPCRVHGFLINKKLQKGAMTGIVYYSAPQEILHSWVEVLLDGRWYELEGFILDKGYLGNLQAAIRNAPARFAATASPSRTSSTQWSTSTATTPTSKAKASPATLESMTARTTCCKSIARPCPRLRRLPTAILAGTS